MLGVVTQMNEADISPQVIMMRAIQTLAPIRYMIRLLGNSNRRNFRQRVIDTG